MNEIDKIITKVDSEVDELREKNLVNIAKEFRSLNHPDSVKHLERGYWQGSRFIFDDNFVPKNANNEKRTIKQIKHDLHNSFKIDLDEINFEYGVADMSKLSICNISLEDIIKNVNDLSYDDCKSLIAPDKYVPDYLKYLSNTITKERREANFYIADKIAAELQLPIPGLKEGYTKKELTTWRKAHNFSWHEQVNKGYLLVPSVIHSNIPHIGAVGILKYSYDYMEKDDYGEYKYKRKFVDEEESIISISELYKKNKGGKNMAYKQVYTRGMKPGQHGFDENIDHGLDPLIESGERYLADKKAIEKEIEKIKDRNFVDDDHKKEMISLLESKLEILKYQFEEKIVEKAGIINKEIDENNNFLEKSIEEQDSISKELSNLEMTEGNIDFADSVEMVEEKKAAFEKQRHESIEKQKLRNEQLKLLRSEMFRKKLSGK